MKVTPEHLAAMRSAIKPLDTDERRQRYLVGDFARAEFVQDLDKRYRWDLFYLSKSLWKAIPPGVYKDTHIDTALRSIVPPLERKQS